MVTRSIKQQIEQGNAVPFDFSLEALMGAEVSQETKENMLRARLGQISKESRSIKHHRRIKQNVEFLLAYIREISATAEQLSHELLTARHNVKVLMGAVEKHRRGLQEWQTIIPTATEADFQAARSHADQARAEAQQDLELRRILEGRSD